MPSSGCQKKCLGNKSMRIPVSAGKEKRYLEYDCVIGVRKSL